MTRSVALLEREYGNRLEKGRQEAAHYRLQPGLALQPDPGGDGGVMVALRPLMAMRLNRPAFGLLSALSGNGARADAAALAAGMPAADAEAFCDRLVRRRILARTPPVPAVWPSVSIIVAAHGRHAATRACITSLLALDYPGGPCEIIVVDDASEPPLAPALDGLPIRLIRVEQNIGQSAARNRAAADAQGDLLAFIDNDCVAEPDWLRALVPHFADPGVAIVGGRVVAPAQRGRIAAFEAVRSPLDMGRMDAAVGPDEAIAYLPTCNLVVRRDALLAAGGFRADMRVGEDVDFTWRVLRTGAAARYVPAGRVIHHHRTRPGALLRRRADYGSSEADLQRRHPGHRRMMPMPRVCLLLLAALTLLLLAWLAAGALLALLGGAAAFRDRRQEPPAAAARRTTAGAADRCGGAARAPRLAARPQRQPRPLLRRTDAGSGGALAGAAAGRRGPAAGGAGDRSPPAAAGLRSRSFRRPLLAGNGRLSGGRLARLPRPPDAPSPPAHPQLEKVSLWNTGSDREPTPRQPFGRTAPLPTTRKQQEHPCAAKTATAFRSMPPTMATPRSSPRRPRPRRRRKSRPSSTRC
ncbi:MAG: mycofactocin biosynthesis glycosyltransferase MftF [Rhodospirillales bacterium]